MGTIKIVSASDSRYIQHLAVTFVSLLENTSKKKEIELFVIDGGLSPKDKDLLRLCILRYGCSLKFLTIEPSLYEKFPQSPSASTATYFRIFVPELLDTNIDKVIYLDCDIVVRGDISELWDLDISEYFLAAVEDCGIEHAGMYTAVIKKKLGMQRRDKYFNAGVLVMNLKKMREDNTSGKVSKFLVENPEKAAFADQDGLNVILKNQWLELALEWNQQGAHCELFEKKQIISDSMYRAVKAPKLIHYTTTYYINTKPWHFKDMHPFKEEYYKYLDNTPWKSYVPSDSSFANALYKMFFKSFAGSLFKRYTRFVDISYYYDRFFMPRKMADSAIVKFIYYLLFPIGYYYMNFMSLLARLSYELEKRNQASEDPVKSFFRRMAYLAVLPSRYLVYGYLRTGLIEETFGEKYTCPCCGYKTLKTRIIEADGICGICYWKNDTFQLENPDSEKGANEVSLNQARINFKNFGASDLRYRYFVRKPGRYDKKDRDKSALENTCVKHKINMIG